MVKSDIEYKKQQANSKINKEKKRAHKKPVNKILIISLVFLVMIVTSGIYGIYQSVKSNNQTYSYRPRPSIAGVELSDEFLSEYEKASDEEKSGVITKWALQNGVGIQVGDDGAIYAVKDDHKDMLSPPRPKEETEEEQVVTETYDQEAEQTEQQVPIEENNVEQNNEETPVAAQQEEVVVEEEAQ